MFVVVKDQEIKVLKPRKFGETIYDVDIRIETDRLDNYVPQGHKVYLEFNDNNICTTCIDLTRMFPNEMPDEDILKEIFYGKF